MSNEKATPNPNMRFYELYRAVPENAQKPIPAGRLKGFTDINPMWRIKCLTELFGPCGTGWDYTVTDKRIEHGANGEIAVFVDIALCYKETPESDWSAPVVGMGGAMFVAKETKGLYTNDDCFKSALTDAIGSACKQIGIGADVYWNKDASKYDKPEEPAPTPPPAPQFKLSKDPDTFAMQTEILSRIGGDLTVADKSARKTYKRGFCELTQKQLSEVLERLDNANNG